MSDPKDLKRWAENPPRNALVQIPPPEDEETDPTDPTAPSDPSDPIPIVHAPPTHVQVMQAPSHNPIGRMGQRFTGKMPMGKSNAMAKAGKGPAAKGSRGAKAKAWARSKAKKTGE